MENYSKGKNVEEPLDRDKIPILGLPNDFLWMQVKGGSKVINLLNHASSLVESGGVRTVVWSGVGVGIGKAISCAEILKRDLKFEHQITKICYKKVEEYWDPKLEGLETLVVKREVPVVHILISSDPVDTSQTGYQSRTGKAFWQCERQIKNKQQTSYNKSKKPFKPKQKHIAPS